MRRWPWRGAAVTIAMLAAIALTAALTLNALLVASLQPLPESPEVVDLPVREPSRGQKSVEAILARNIFNSQGVAALRSAGGDLEGAGRASGKRLPRARLDAVLVAVIATGKPDASFVELREHPRGDAEVFRVGDWILGRARIVGIEPRRVIVLHRGEREEIVLFSDGRWESPRRYDRRVLEISPGRYEIARAEVDRQLRDIPGLMRQAVARPYYEHGRMAGVHLYRVRRAGVFARIGLRTGDVLRRVNGKSVNSVEAALALYGSLKSADRIVLDVARGRSRRTLSYRIVD